MELNASNNTTSMSPQQWSKTDGHLQAPTYMPPHSYQINQYDPQYSSYQSMNYQSYPTYNNMIPVEYYATSQANNDHQHSHHGNARVSAPYENGINAYIQYIHSDHQQVYTTDNSYHQLAYTPYKATIHSSNNTVVTNSRPHKQNKYTNSNTYENSSSSGKQIKADSLHSNSKSTNKHNTNTAKDFKQKEESDNPGKQLHKWSDIVSGKNNDTSKTNNNENDQITSGGSNKENYDQENDINENSNHYNNDNYTEHYFAKPANSKANSSKSSFNNNNSSADSAGYINSNGKYYNNNYGMNHYGYNQYGLDGKCI